MAKLGFLNLGHLFSESSLLSTLWTQREVGQDQDYSLIDLSGDVRKALPVQKGAVPTSNFRKETACHVPRTKAMEKKT